jgi:predicted amidophosphoribosyltransferase
MLLRPVCPICRRPGGVPCGPCRDQLRPAPPDAPVPAIIAYEGVGRELLARLKYRDARQAVAPLADALAARAAEARGLIDTSVIDTVTWIPTTDRRRRERGFDQAELLARAVARRLGRPCRRLLRRLGDDHQTGRTRSERLLGPRLVAVGVVPTNVLLIDDVVTTGATVRAAVEVLTAAGAVSVQPWVAAATPSMLNKRQSRADTFGNE